MLTNNNNNLETLYKTNFEDFKIKPSDKVWNNIEQKMKTTHHNGLRKILAVTVLALLSVATSLAFYTFKDKNTNKAQAIETDKTITDIDSVRKYQQNTDFNSYNNELTTKNNTDNIHSYSKQTPQNKIATNTSIQKENLPTYENYYNAGYIGAIIGIPIFLELITEDTKNKKDLQFFTSKDIGCEPLTVDFQNNVPQISSIVWDFGDNHTSLTDNPQHIYEEAGTYYVKMQCKDAEEDYIFYDTIIVNKSPEADFSFTDESLNTELKTDSEIEFVNYSSYADAYTWDFGDHQISYENEPKHKFAKIGKYDVKLVAISSDNCKDSAKTTINIEYNRYVIVFPNAFYPNLSGPNGGVYSKVNFRNDVFCPAVATDVEEYSLSIYSKSNDLIFRTDDIKVGWDGYVNGKIVETGVYIYDAKGKFANGTTFIRRGDVTVLKK